MKILRYIVIAIILLFIVGCGSKDTELQSQQTSAPDNTATQEPATGTEDAAETTEDAVDAATDEEGVMEIPETDMGPGLVTEDQLATGEYVQHSDINSPQFKDAELAKDLTAKPERFSNFDCSIDEESGIRYVSLKVTNTNADRPLMISPKGVAKGYDTYFLIRGIVDTDPGCQADEVAPGESTMCMNIGFDTKTYGNTAGLNKINIQSPSNDGKKNTESVVVNCPE